MAQNITLLGANYPDVPAVTLPITGGGTATFSDTRSVTYNLSGGATASVTPSEAVAGQGFSVKLTAPTGYALSGVTVTMGGTDITSQVFAPDEVGGGGGGTPAISVVDTTDSHGGTVRTITALDISDTTAVASDVAQGKYFYTAQGVKTTGTGSGGSPSATQHSIYFEFSDSTNTTVNAWYDDSFISDAITATTPTTYGSKTVTLAQLDGVTWYEPTPIPLNTQLIDYTAITTGYIIDGNTGEESEQSVGYCSDFTEIDPSMTFTYIGYQWWDAAFYDSSKTFISGFMQYNYADSITDDYAHGTLTPARIPSNAKYIRLTSYPSDNPSNATMSLIRTA